MPKYEGECIEEVELCYGTDDYSLYNDTMQRQCRDQACYTCKDVSIIVIYVGLGCQCLNFGIRLW